MQFFGVLLTIVFVYYPYCVVKLHYTKKVTSLFGSIKFDYVLKNNNLQMQLIRTENVHHFHENCENYHDTKKKDDKLIEL